MSPYIYQALPYGISIIILAVVWLSLRFPTPNAKILIKDYNGKVLMWKHVAFVVPEGKLELVAHATFRFTYPGRVCLIQVESLRNPYHRSEMVTGPHSFFPGETLKLRYSLGADTDNPTLTFSKT